MKHNDRSIVGAAHRTAIAALLLLLTTWCNASEPAPVTKDGITLRFVEAGEFRESHMQGMELELINTTDQPIACEIQLVLYRTPPDCEALEVHYDGKPTQIPAHARNGFRVAEPLTYGQCRVEYEVKVNGVVFASSEFTFQASGPYRLDVRPWFLSKNSVQVNLLLLEPGKPNQRFHFKLMDKNRKKVLFQTDQSTRLVDESPYVEPSKAKTTVQAFVDFGKQRPGDYVVEVDVLDETSATPMALARLYCPVILTTWPHD